MTDATAGHRWWTYARERSPLPALIVVGLAQSLSACYLVRHRLDVVAVALAAVGIVGLLVLMRLMDELKDVEKDRIAHPQRPLPRGLLSVPEVRRAVSRLGLGLLAYAAIMAVVRSPLAGAIYAFSVGYAFLMFREFFVGPALNRNALVYALTHQVIVIPMYLFCVASVDPDVGLSPPAIWFALTGLGASFVFEVSRKLDPAADPILGTYLRRHGRAAVVVTILAALTLLALSAYRIDVHRIVWPAAAVMLAVVPLIYVQPHRFRTVEAASTLLGFVQMLAPTLRHAWQSLG